MLRMYIPIILIAIFAGWILYRLLVKKDLRSKLNELYYGLFFIAAWGLIYFFMLK